MKIRYFEATDTLYIEFGRGPVGETRDLGADAVGDFGADGALCAITIEHASVRAQASVVSFEHVSKATHT